MAFYRKTLTLDPLMSINHGDIVDIQVALGHFDDAQREIDAAPGAANDEWKMTSRWTVLLGRHDYDAALKLFEEKGFPRQLPSLHLEYANTLRMAGRPDDAFREVTGLVATNPADCAASATLAALRQERGLSNIARQTVAPALAAAAADGAGPLAIRCGVLSLSAIGDAAGVAALAKRVAASERLLRLWAVDILGMSGSALLQTGLYPVSRVSGEPALADARRDMDQADAALRVQIASALADITPQ